MSDDFFKLHLKYGFTNAEVELVMRQIELEIEDSHKKSAFCTVPLGPQDVKDLYVKAINRLKQEALAEVNE